jgi:hypothetical protein
MNRTITLGGALAAFCALRCGLDESRALTVGFVDAAAVDAGGMDAGAIDGGAIDAGAIDGSATFILVTPSTEPLSETSVRVTWPAPQADVAYYDIRISSDPASEPDPRAAPALAHIAPTATSAVVSGLPPGTLGRVVVAAGVASGAAIASPSSVLWTPYGAINEDSVNSVTPLAGYAAAPYAESMFVSANFSMFFAHAYLKEASFVFKGLPPSPTARAVYNFASPIIKYPNGFRYPDVADVAQIWSDGVSKVLLSESTQHRVLVYSHLPLSPDTAAPDLILGQVTWTGTSSNDGQSSVNARGFNQASGACFNGTTLYVRDNVNNRILGWHGWPTQMGQAADFVLGQPDTVSSTPNNGGVSKGTLSFGIDGGNSVDCRGGMLAVADPGNSRILIWKTAPTQSGVPADIVLGQSAGNQRDPGGAGGLGVGGMLTPQSVATLGNGVAVTAVVVADRGANRVTGWDAIPTVDGAPFDRVYGQPDRTTITPNTGGLSMSSLDFPISISVDHENRFWVADFNNGRVLRFDLKSPAAIGVFGQRDGATTEMFPGSFSTTRSPWSHWADKGAFSLDSASGLYSASFWRGMFWNVAPADGNTPVSAVQGQADATRSTKQPVSATSISNTALAVSAVMVGERVYWSDTSRILSKVGKFTTNNSIPDAILGNQDYQGNTVAPTTLDYAIQPSSLATDGHSLLAVDGARIVGWNPAPGSSHRPIDFAIGQPSVLENVANNGGLSARSLGGARIALTTYKGKLIVADPANHRVLIWNAVPSASGVPADVVLGQADFVSSVPGGDATKMNAPSSVAVLNGKLVVSDTGNARLLVFNQIPATSGVAADRIWDPRTVRFSLPAWFNEEELSPHDLGAYQGRLYVGQTGRVLVLPDIFVQ